MQADFSEVIEDLMEPVVKHSKKKRCAKAKPHNCLLGCGELVSKQEVVYKLMDGTTRHEKVFVGYCTTCQSYLKDGEYHKKSKFLSTNPFSVTFDKY